MEIMNQVVLHLSEMERTSGNGMDRDELIEWYLEQKESEFESMDDLEYERQLIAKALTKLAKDNYLLEIRGDVRQGLQEDDADAESSAAAASSDKIFYLVHPQVDLSDLSSSVPVASA
jgi:DNA replication licensing factor MCM6